MNVKLPFVADISHWKEVADFATISPRPLMIITKATEGNWQRDNKFIRFMGGMKEAGIKRGAFHFHRKSVSGQEQAEYFCNFIRPYIDDETLLVLDVEEGGESSVQLKAWFDHVRAAFPNRVAMYSRRNILDTVVMSEAQKMYFRGVPIWAAGYPIDPDEYSEVPSFYIPDPSKFGPVILWQYSEKGQIAGIEGDVDLNWISPTFLQLIGGETPPATGETMDRWKATWDAGCNKRPAPNTNNTAVGVIADNTEFDVMGYFIPDGKTQAQEYWGKLIDGYWVALAYNSQPRAVLVSAPPPVDPNPTIVLKHTVKVYSDGSLIIDDGAVIP